SPCGRSCSARARACSPAWTCARSATNASARRWASARCTSFCASAIERPHGKSRSSIRNVDPFPRTRGAFAVRLAAFSAAREPRRSAMQVAEKSAESANPIREGEYARPHADLREWIERVDRMGELLRVSGAEWHLEMGAIAEMVYADQPQNPPAILFENVPGYSKEFRVLSGMTNSPRRLALTLGLPTPSHPLDVVRAYRDRMKKHQLIPNVFVQSGPIFENVDRDDKVDLYKFPTPHLHELDGGRFIGTGVLVIMRDPDSEWVNC